MSPINPYLNFGGHAEEAFNFYKSVFGGEFAMVMRFKDTPPEFKLKEEEQNLIMHIALPIGDGTMLMASDIAGDYPKPTIGNNIQLMYSAKSKEEADKVYNGLSEGGKASMPMSDQFWGAYFGQLTDKFGVGWMVSYDATRQ